MVTRDYLESLFNSMLDSHPVPTALIKYENSFGIAVRLGCNLSSSWQEGEVLVVWDDSDYTVLPDTFELVRLNLMSD